MLTLPNFSFSSDQDGNGVAAMDQGWGGVPIEANVLHSPLAYSGVKPKLRKKVTTFANPPVELVNTYASGRHTYYLAN